MMRLQTDAKTSSQVPQPPATLSSPVNQDKGGGGAEKGRTHARYNEPLSKWLTVQVATNALQKVRQMYLRIVCDNRLSWPIY